jgi:hypothetical protein
LIELTNQEVARSTARAEQMSVYLVRAFVKLRESLTAHTQLARELATLKCRVDTLDADTRKQFAGVRGDPRIDVAADAKVVANTFRILRSFLL